MNDKVEKYYNSLIQHGKMNDRIYLMKLAEEDSEEILTYLEELAIANGYTKIIAKVPHKLRAAFLQRQYKQEAYIEKFFRGTEACCFLSKYFDETRASVINSDNIFTAESGNAIREELAETPELSVPSSAYHVKKLDSGDLDELAHLYSQVFPQYPFPIQDTNYLKQTMQANVDYFGVFFQQQLIAASSSEMDMDNKNTEMTDFATLPKFRAMGLSRILLAKMEKSAKQQGIVTAYTIARATSYAINLIFAKGRYQFAGMLPNNTNIYSGIESMNVWAKQLS